MPFNAKVTATRQALPKPEILAFPLETNVIESAVIRAAGVDADVSGPYTGRRYLVAGTILTQREDGTYDEYEAGTGSGSGSGDDQTIAGILFDTVEFADATAASNEPAAFLRRNCSFDKNKIANFDDFEDELVAWGKTVNVEFIDAAQNNV